MAKAQVKIDDLVDLLANREKELEEAVFIHALIFFLFLFSLIKKR